MDVLITTRTAGTGEADAEAAAGTRISPPAGEMTARGRGSRVDKKGVLHSNDVTPKS